MKKSRFSIILMVVGLALLGIGLFLIKAIPDSQEFMLVVPYICIGIGCGTFGYGGGEILREKAIKNSPKIAKQIEIDLNDERNIAIGNKAKSKAFDMMLYMFAVLMISFALMRINLIAILLLVGAYLFIVGYSIYCHYKYTKEM